MKKSNSSMQTSKRRIFSSGTMSPVDERKNICSKNFECPDTGNIPDRLLLSRACFRLFPAKQISLNLVPMNKN